MWCSLLPNMAGKIQLSREILFSSKSWNLTLAKAHFLQWKFLVADASQLNLSPKLNRAWQLGRLESFQTPKLAMVNVHGLRGLERKGKILFLQVWMCSIVLVFREILKVSEINYVIISDLYIKLSKFNLISSFKWTSLRTVVTSTNVTSYFRTSWRYLWWIFEDVSGLFTVGHLVYPFGKQEIPIRGSKNKYCSKIRCVIILHV